MTSDLLLDLLDSILMSQIISIICQTFFFGIYFCLFPISIYVMVTKGLQTRSQKWLFAMTIAMFVLSSVYWVVSVYDTFISINLWRGQFDHVRRKPLDWLQITDALPLVNYIITDAVVVWRAWVLCSDQYRVVLIFPVVVLAINTLLYLFTVAMSAVLVIVFGEGRRLKGRHLSHIMSSAQIANLALSLLANISATSIMAVKAWKYRKTLMMNGDGIRTPTRAVRILGLVVESGMLYILIGVVALVSPFIDLPSGTLSVIFLPSAGQLAGMYPIVVLLLVETKRSLNTTYFSSSSLTNVRVGQRSQIEPMSFDTGPVLATGSQIESQASQPRMNGHEGEPINATSLSPTVS